jgi:hypothetical protein
VGQEGTELFGVSAFGVYLYYLQTSWPIGIGSYGDVVTMDWKMLTTLDRRSLFAGLGSMLALFALPGLSLPTQPEQNSVPKKAPGRFGDLDEDTMFDVCIVGSGFAGAVLGEALVRKGVRVIILESGPDASRPPIDPRFRELEVFRNSGPIDYPIASSRFRGVGGTSTLWTGRCSRLDPGDFASWPITYTELEPFYDKAEELLRVRGGQLSKYHPPRKKGLSLPPDRDISTLKSLLLKAGIVVDDALTSTGQEGHYPIRVAESYLPRFQSSPYGTLVSEVTVTRLLTDANGMVVGAEVKDLDRHVKIVRARAYVVACGGLESPRLLLLSRSQRFPNGIGNDSDWIGRCFMEHKSINFFGRVTTDGFLLYPQVGRSLQFYKEFKEQHLGGTGLGFKLISVMPDDLKGWKLTELWGRLSRISSRIWHPVLTIGGHPEMPPVPENRVTLHKEVRTTLAIRSSTFT